MRFLELGPSIPDELLLARDAGRVIFFCGAGVSRARAGLPDFYGLALNVIDRLEIAADTPARRLLRVAKEIEDQSGMRGLVSADRIFGLLEREFESQDIEAAVARELQPKPDVDLSAHRILLDLARGPDARVRLVTTNFERLFEACDASLPSWAPPHLPDPRQHDAFSGIVHLHGVTNAGQTEAADGGFVLSSSQFGHAYLAEGWATRFMRALLEKYVVVFVGYTADDPPVQYLLEALNRTLGARPSLYAFHAKSTTHAESTWIHRGVQPIPYEASNAHQALWDTLAAWAERARDVSGWYARNVSTALKGPQSLKPFERGQVVHVVSTTEGARAFSECTPPPPAAWLGVFDSHLRFAAPARTYDETGTEVLFDPFTVFAIDDDPIPPAPPPDEYVPKREIPLGVADAFKLTRDDRLDLKEYQVAALKGLWASNVPVLASRLGQLGTWLAHVCHEPFAVWWAAGQHGVHPAVQQQIRIELTKRPPAESAVTVSRTWQYLLEAWQHRAVDADQRWSELGPLIRLDGWDARAVREFARLLRPAISVERPHGPPPLTPGETSTAIREVARIDVDYPRIDEQVVIPDAQVLPMVREFRRNLELAVGLERELGGHGLTHLPPIEPDAAADGEATGRDFGIAVPFFGFVTLYRRLVGLDAAAAKAEFLLWPTDEDAAFARLRMWACGQRPLLSGEEVAAVMGGLNDDVFWQFDHQRDLLLTLAARWKDFPEADRTRIRQRLLKGPAPREDVSDEEQRTVRALASLDRLQWLRDQGCRFSFDFDRETQALRSLAKEWRPEDAHSAASSWESRMGTVRMDTRHDPLLTVPITDVVSTAAALSGRAHDRLEERDPFGGLVAHRPVRALRALTALAKRNEFPAWAWRRFLAAEPRSSDRLRLAALIAARVAALPRNVAAELGPDIARWLLASSQMLLTHAAAKFYVVWDQALAVLRSQPAQGKSTIVRGDEATDWVTEALNSSVGRLADALMNDPSKNNRPRGGGFPNEWIGRIGALLSLEGDARRYALALFSYRLHWFFAVDPAWTQARLLSAMTADDQDQEAFWAGFLSKATAPGPELFLLLKAQLFELACADRLPGRANISILAGMILIGWHTRPDGADTSVVSDRELRQVLVLSSEEFRLETLRNVKRWLRAKGSESDSAVRWAADIPRLFSDVWPRHKSAKSPRVTAAVCELLFALPARFPELVDVVRPRLTVVDTDHLSWPKSTHAEHDVATLHPEKMLDLLWTVLAVDARVWPYGADRVLVRIAAARPSLKSDPRWVELNRRWQVR